LADQTRPLIGNYAGQPTHIVSVLDGLKAEFPGRNYLCSRHAVPADRWDSRCRTALLTTPDGKPGLKAEYNEGMAQAARPGSSQAAAVSHAN
jgi:beta-glucosidase